MARYINWADVTGRYPDAAKAQGGSEVVKANYVTGAEDEVDGRCAAKYTVPFSPVPGIIRDLCVDLAYFKMIVKNPKAAKALKEYIDERFEAIIDGTLIITTSAGLLTPADGAWATDQYPTAFGVDRDENWQVPSDWVDANKASRE